MGALVLLVAVESLRFVGIFVLEVDHRHKAWEAFFFAVAGLYCVDTSM